MWYGVLWYGMVRYRIVRSRYGLVWHVGDDSGFLIRGKSISGSRMIQMISIVVAKPLYGLVNIHVLDDILSLIRITFG